MAHFDPRWHEPQTDFEPLLICPDCKVEMRLLGIETDGAAREIYTFECRECGDPAARSLTLD